MPSLFTRFPLLLLSLFSSPFWAFPLPAFAAESPVAPLRILNFMPAEAERPLARILVRFSEAMRPLGTLEEAADTAPLRITSATGPVPEGQFRWVDPATLSYVFTSPVTTPVELNVCVPAGTKALSGSSLEKEFCQTAATPILQIVLPNASRGERLPKDATIYIQSTYALNFDDLKAKMSITLNGKTLPVELTALEDAGAPYTTLWTYTAKILTPLPMDADVYLKLEPGIRVEGSTVKSTGLGFGMKTYTSLRLKEWHMEPEYGARESKKKAPESQLSLTFNNLVTRKALLAHLEISPKVPMQVLSDAEKEPWDEESWDDDPMGGPQYYHHLYFQWEPRTTYTVTLRGDLADEYGGSLTKDKTFTFTTGDMYPVFDMPNTGIRYMELSLGGQFPIAALNTSPIKVQLRYAPWKGLTPRDSIYFTSMDAKEFAAIPGAVEVQHTLDFSDKPNRDARHMLDIPKLLGLSSAADLRGPVSLVVESPLPPDRVSGSSTHTSHSVLLQMTKLGLHVRAGKNDGLVWATNLETGLPAPGVTLHLICPGKGLTAWEGTTDSDGLAPLSPIDEETCDRDPLLLADYEGETTGIFVSRTGAYPPYGGWVGSWQAHVVSQLPLYQPGQEARFILYAAHVVDKEKGRPLDPPAWRPLTNKTLTLTIRDSNYQVVASIEAKTNRYGSVSASLPLPKDAPSGWYRVETKAEGLTGYMHSAPFQVASFRPPDFKVDLTVPADQPAPVGMAEAAAEAAKAREAVPVPRSSQGLEQSVAQSASQARDSGQTAAQNKTAVREPEAPLEVAVQAGYFSGAPMPGAAVAISVFASETWFTPTPLQGYSVGNAYPYYGRGWFHGDMAMASEPYHGQRAQPLAMISGVLDEKGNMRCDVPPVPITPGQTSTVTFEATVTDPSGLTSQGTGAFVLHPSAAYVGLRAPYIALANTDMDLEVRAATWDNQPLAGVDVHLKAERIVRHKKAPEPAWEKTVTVQKAEGQSFPVRFERGGEYQLTATITDDKGRKNSTTVTVYVPGNEPLWFGGAEGKALELLPDAQEYTPGQTARILVKNPFADMEKVQALITTERGGVRSSRLQTVSGAAPVIEVPLTTADAPYIFVGVTLIKGRTAPPPDMGVTQTTEDTGAPAVAYAITRLLVQGEPQGIKASVTTDAKEYRPGGKVRATVAVTTAAGKPRKAQVTLLAVDDRILRAAGEQTNYDLEKTFQAVFAYGLTQADTRDILLNLGIRQLGFSPEVGFVAKQRIRTSALMMDAYAPEPTAAGRDQGQATPRANFTPMAHWLAAGETDDTGTLTEEFTLPDTLTSYRVVAVVMDAQAQFTTTETQIQANKPLQLVSSLPRFLTGTDRLEARILVQNTSADQGTVTVTATGEGLTLEKDTQTLTLAPGTSGVASFPVQVAMPNLAALAAAGSTEAGGLAQATASLTVHAVMDTGKAKETDDAHFVVPVHSPRLLTTVAAAGLLKAGEEYRLPVRLQVPSGEELDPRSRLEVIFAASPAAGLSLTADTVLEYPWGCLEQRLSKAWVRAIRLQHGDLLGMQAVAEDADILREVMASVPNFQTSSGGFSLWDGNGRSDAYLTAYALIVNSHMRALKVTPPIGLPADVTDKALAYLQDALQRSLKPRDKESDDEYFGAETRAMALLALSEYPSKATMVLLPKTIAAIEKEKGVRPMTWAAMALALEQTAGIEEKPALMQRVRAKLDTLAVITPTELHFAVKGQERYWYSMGSTLRDNGLVLATLARINPDYPRLEALALWVNRGIADRGRYLSTQEGIFGLWGLTSYLETLGGKGPVEMKAVWNNGASMTHTFAQLIDPPQKWVLPAASLATATTAETPKDDKKLPALVMSALQGNPHWTARLRYASPAVPAKAENMGFAITRVWPTAEAWRVGDVVEVKLTVTVDAYRRHALVFEPFPAGFEPLYATRVDLAQRERGYQYPWEWQDVRNDGILLYTRDLEAGTYTYTYKLRAAAPGSFVLRPAQAEEMYSPEVFGRTVGGTVEVRGE